jgi:hypothetical protein
MLGSLLFLLKKKQNDVVLRLLAEKNENKKRMQSNRRFLQTAGSPVFPVLSGSHRSNCMTGPTFEPDRSPPRFAV